MDVLTQSDYRRLEEVLRHFITHGRLPSDFESHEGRRSNYDCTLPPALLSRWRDHFHAPRSSPLVIPHEGEAQRVHILLVEGFLTFFDTRVCRLLHVRIFLRVTKATIKKRREERANYVLDDGDVWEDPPFYFDEIVWPAYLEAHQRMFERGDVEAGKPIAANERTEDGGPVPRLCVIEAERHSTDEVVGEVCQAVYELWK